MPAPLIPMPVRAAFSYKKKIGRREYVRVTLRKPRTVRWRRSNFRAKERACLSSLVETDGLVELNEDMIRSSLETASGSSVTLSLM